VGELVGRRHLEAVNMAALRVEGAHDVLDRAALAGRVDALEDDQDPLAALRPETLLKIGQPLEVPFHLRGRRRLRVAERRRCVCLRKLDVFAGPDDELVAQAAMARHGLGQAPRCAGQ
jgi:hypothetical protein